MAMTPRPPCYHSDPLQNRASYNDKKTPLTVKKTRGGYKAVVVTEIQTSNLSMKTMLWFVKLICEYRETLGDIKIKCM